MQNGASACMAKLEVCNVSVGSFKHIRAALGGGTAQP